MHKDTRISTWLPIDRLMWDGSRYKCDRPVIRRPAYYEWPATGTVAPDALAGAVWHAVAGYPRLVLHKPAGMVPERWIGEEAPSVIAVPATMRKRLNRGQLNPETAGKVRAALTVGSLTPFLEMGEDIDDVPMRQPWEDAAADPADIAADAAEQEEHRQAVRDALATLPKESADMLRMAYGLNGQPLSVREIARKVNMSKSAVDRRIQKAKDDMRSAIAYSRAALAHQESALAELECISLDSGDIISNVAGHLKANGPYTI